jgi:hypothetical protein
VEVTATGQAASVLALDNQHRQAGLPEIDPKYCDAIVRR